MARAKTGTKRRQRHNRWMKLAKGFRGGRKRFRQAKQQVINGLSRSTHEEAQLPRSLDCAYQRSRPRIGQTLQHVHRWPQESRHRNRPQGPFRYRDLRSARLRGDRQKSRDLISPTLPRQFKRYWAVSAVD